MEDITNWEETASYVIHKDDADTIAINGDTGKEDSRNTDSATVIQYAIDALTDGGKIFIKAGTYVLTSSIEVKDNIHLDGEYPATILKNADATRINPLSIDNHDYVFIENLAIDGNRANNTDDAPTNVLNGIYINKSHYVKISNVYIYNAVWHGITIDHVGGAITHLEVDNCIAKNIMYDGFRLMASTSFSRWTNNKAAECEQDGFFLDNLKNSTVTGNVAEHNERFGFNISGIEVLINDNYADRNGRHGFLSESGLLYSQIVGNKTAANGDGTNDTFSGLCIHDSTYNFVKANDFRGKGYLVGTGYVTYQKYGISETGTSDYNIIEDNDVREQNTAGILKAGAATVVRRNTGHATENSGASGVIADGATIAHGMAVTPTHAVISGTVAGEIVNVTALGAANLTIAIKDNAGAAGTNQAIYWRAWV